MEKLVVTRYKSLVTYLKKIELINDNTKIISHAKIEDVQNKHVIGVLPYWLSCHTGKFTEIQLRILSEKRGQELTVDEIEFYSLDPHTYEVREVDFE